MNEIFACYYLIDKTINIVSGYGLVQPGPVLLQVPSGVV